MHHRVQVGHGVGRVHVLIDQPRGPSRRLRDAGGVEREQGHVGKVGGGHGEPRLRLPRRDLTVAVHGRAQLQKLGGALGVETVLLLPRPLHAYGPSGGLGEQGRLGCRVVSAVRAVGAGAVQVDNADALALDTEHARAGGLEAVGVLRRAPHRDGVGAHVGHPARGTDGAVRLDGPAVGRAEELRARGRRAQGGEIAALGDLLVAHDATRPHRLELLRVVGQPGARRPLGLESPRGADGVPLAVGDHGEEALDADHAGALDGRDGRLVHGDQGGAQRGRMDHAGVQHVGQHQIVEILVAPRDLGGQVGPGQRLADEAEAVGRLERRLSVDLQVEGLVADEIAVGDGAAAVLRPHHAVSDLEIAHGLAEACGGPGEEGLARGGRGVADLGTAAGDGVAARRRALVRRERGVALDHGDAIEGDIELLSSHLAHGDASARADVDLAREEGHRAVGVDGEVGVDEIRCERLAEEAVGIGHGLGEQPLRAFEAQAHDERAARGEKSAARDHREPPATLSTARITRAWLPQRQRLPASASRTCASLGRGVLVRSARAATTKPAVQ